VSKTGVSDTTSIPFSYFWSTRVSGHHDPDTRMWGKGSGKLMSKCGELLMALLLQKYTDVMDAVPCFAGVVV